MKRILVAAAALCGFLLVAGAVLLGLLLGGGRSASALVPLLAIFLGLPALVAAAWKLRGTLDATSDRPVPWAERERFATPAPERSNDEHPLSSDGLARTLEGAGRTARSEGTVADGVAVVTPALREALVEAMVRGEWDRESAREAVATGEWTDDRTAASVVSPDVSPPSMSIRRRVYAWLFPERVVRRRIRRAVQELAEVADESLPTVPGQTAPRTVPVRKPRLEELRRDAEGKLQGAVDPDAIARGPDPPEPDLDAADGDGTGSEEWEPVAGGRDRRGTGTGRDRWDSEGDGRDRWDDGGAGSAQWDSEGDGSAQWESVGGDRRDPDQDGSERWDSSSAGSDRWEPVDREGGRQGDDPDRRGSDEEVTDA